MILANYLEQIVYIQTTADEILLVKVKSNNDDHNGYKINVLEQNEETVDLDMTILNIEIKRICILPMEIQQGIEITARFIPSLEFKDIQNLPSTVELGICKANY